MERKGSAILPLHYGHPPEYLYRRMVKLGGLISDLIIERFGVEEYLEKVSDPFWFHSLSLAIGFDWNSSGTTTATLSAIKEHYSRLKDTPVFILGGKGRHLGEMAAESTEIVSTGALSESKMHRIMEDARRIARVDQNLLIDGFDLYMQFLVLDTHGKWSIVQQGMNPQQRMARRYHWISRTGLDFFNDGRNGISAPREMDRVVDLTTGASEGNRRSMLEMAREDPFRYRMKLIEGPQRTLDNFQNQQDVLRLDYRINWAKMREIYEYQPSSFQDIAFMKGMGRSTIRALSYLAEIIYGEKPSFRDPVKFSFAVGGKDGVPKPVNVADYDRAIEFYSEVLRGTRERDATLEHLARKLLNDSTSHTVTGRQHI